jgi:hypothetical protein
LCSFGRARSHTSAPPGGADPNPDVRALARLLISLLDSKAPSRLDRTLRRAVARGRGRGGGDARLLARQLAASVPGTRLPGGPGPAVETISSGPRRTGSVRSRRDRFGFSPGRGRRLIAMVLAGSGVAAVTIYVATSRSSVPGRRVGCPAVDSGCTPVPTPGGVLTTSDGRYAVGEAGDVVVLGRWRCGLPALPAVLRPRTGQLWVFAAWPKPGQSVAGQLVAGHLAHAASLRVVVEHQGCDGVEVERRGGLPLTVAVPR